MTSRFLFLALLLVAFLATPSAFGESEAARYAQLDESQRAFTAAVAAHRRGDLESAERGYRAAISQDATFVEAMVNLARVHIEQRELAEAATWLDRAASSTPHYPQIEAVRGLLALADGNAALAVDDLVRARHAAPRDPEVLTNLAAGLLQQGLADEAITLLEEAQRLAPRSPEAAYNRGLAHDRVGDRVRAEHYYRRYLQLAPVTHGSRAGVERRLELIERGRVQVPASPHPEPDLGAVARAARSTEKETSNAIHPSN